MYNQTSYYTGDAHNGRVYEPFNNKLPSEYTEIGTMASQESTRRVKIYSSSEGWASTPDVGGTTLSKNAPIGEPWPLAIYSALCCLWIMFRRKKNKLTALTLLFSVAIQANVTALSYNPSTIQAGNEITVVPTISSVPDGNVYVCWGMYTDFECAHDMDDITFNRAPLAGANAVTCTTPSTAGTYYIKVSLHSGYLCGGVLDSYYVYPIVLHPSDADVVLMRDAQGSGERTDITADTGKAYGAMRFSRSTLNNNNLSSYERYNYFISFPFDVQVADIYGIGTVGTHWRICYYDGKGRAEEGFFAERESNWVMIDDTDSVLHAGQGYLLQLNAIQMAADNEEVWQHRDIATLYFPAITSISAITTANETIPALGESYHCTIDLSATMGDEADRRIKDSYWRCIGMPGFDTYTREDDGIPYLYEWNPADNSLNVVSGNGYTFLPTHAYLIQNGNAIVWTDITKPLYAPANYDAQEYKIRELRLELTNDNGASDRTYICITDNARVTADFNWGYDLIKELNDQRANLYTKIRHERLAANCLPSDSSSITIPVGMTIATKGDYSLALFGGGQDVDVILTDSLTGACTNLSRGCYAVHLEEGVYDSRFSIVVAPAGATPTGLDGVEVDASQTCGRKMLPGAGVVIVRGDAMWDVCGRRIR